MNSYRIKCINQLLLSASNSKKISFVAENNESFYREIVESGGRPPEFLSRIRADGLNESESNETEPSPEKKNATRGRFSNK